MAGGPVLAAGPAVRLSAQGARVLYYGDVQASVESADGAAHRVRVRVQTPAGLQAPDPAELAVPPAGPVTATLRVWRSSAARGTRQPLVVIAEPIDGEGGPAVSQQVFAVILPEPSWMPRLRRPLGVIALLLMATAALLELRRGRGTRSGTSGKGNA